MRIVAHSKDKLQVEVQAGAHDWVADEPVRYGGDDAGPNPYDLLLGALAACKVMTVHMYARRKQWPLESVTINLEHEKVHARDCQDCDTDGAAKVDIINAEISFVGDLDEKQLARLTQIADRCPVHRTLTSETKIRTIMV